MVKNTLLNYILIMPFLFKTRALSIQTYSSLVTISSPLAMTTYFSITFFNQVLLSRFFMRRHKLVLPFAIIKLCSRVST